MNKNRVQQSCATGPKSVAILFCLLSMTMFTGCLFQETATIECEVRTFEEFDFSLQYDSVLEHMDGVLENAVQSEDQQVSAGTTEPFSDWVLAVVDSGQEFGAGESVAVAVGSGGGRRRFRFDGIKLAQLEGNQEYYQLRFATFDPIPEDIPEFVVTLVNNSADRIFFVPRSNVFMPDDLRISEIGRVFGENYFCNYFTVKENESRRILTTASERWIFDVYSWDETLLGTAASPEGESVSLLGSCEVDLDGGATLVWDGVTLSCDEVALVSICLCNDTDRDATIFLEGDNPFDSVVGAGECRVVAAPAGLPVKIFAGMVVDGSFFRDYEIVLGAAEEGDKVILDRGLSIDGGDDDDPPVETVKIEVCNFDEFDNYPNVIMTIGEPVDGVALGLGDCSTLDVPIGAPVEIRMFDETGSTLVATCVIADPSENDDVQWDGISLICSDRD